DRTAILLDQPGADLDMIVDEELLQAGIHEGGQGAGEGLRALRRSEGRGDVRRGLLARWRVRHRRLEASGEGVAAAVDRLDVPLLHLFLEERVRHRDRLLAAGLEDAEQ